MFRFSTQVQGKFIIHTLGNYRIPPTCNAGKTAKLRSFSMLYGTGSLPGPTSLRPRLKKMMPDREPRSVLWVVVVTTSQKGKGEPITPAAMSPETGDISCFYQISSRGYKVEIIEYDSRKILNLWLKTNIVLKRNSY